jgi:hypothetical protein
MRSEFCSKVETLLCEDFILHVLTIGLFYAGKLNEIHRISPEKEGVAMNGHLGSGHSW